MFIEQLHSFSWKRHVWRVDLHHSVVPTIAEYEGVSSIEGIWRNDLERRGWEDIAQHVTIAPDGMIWTGRDWNKTPASIGRRMNLGVFMVEAIGNFDTGRDKLQGAQLDSVLIVIDSVQRRFDLPVQSLLFHRDVPQADNTSPGSSVDKCEILRSVRAIRQDRTGPHGTTRANLH